MNRLANKVLLLKIMLLIACLQNKTANAQPPASSEEKKTENQHPQKDIVDLINHILLHKPDSVLRVSKSSNFSMVPALGYSLQTGFAVALSANTVFYTKKNNSKLSTLLASITYSQYNQIIVPLDADIWTPGNKFKLVSDFRFMKYPSTTYGL